MTTPAAPDADRDTRVDRSAELDADVEEVWEALTDPDSLGRWLGTEVDLDVRPGGAGRVVDPDGTVRQVLVTDVDEHERVAWHWWEDDGPLTSVEITLAPTPTGTRVDVHEIYARVPGARGTLRMSAAAPTTVTPADTASFALAPARWSIRLTALAAPRVVLAARR